MERKTEILPAIRITPSMKARFEELQNVIAAEKGYKHASASNIQREAIKRIMREYGINE